MRFKPKQLFNEFQKLFTVEYIYSTLESCNKNIENYKDKDIKYMIDKEYDVLRLKEDDLILQYIIRIKN